ncbi:MAG: hypothetical protein QOH68_362 [Nocardioidaceae bacterium]|jgi:AcrR family transcriptional regulator|nr:hypothetical protein [Nocardioidaceae bacterium]
MSNTKVDGRTLRHQHRRGELLSALTEYVLDNGIRGLSLRPAAHAVGVTHATLLRHFVSKEDLLLEVVDTVRRDFLTQLWADVDLQSAQSTHDLMRTAWRRLKEPREQRQFLLLFEVIGDAARQPESVGRLSQTIIQDWLEPIERTLVQDGWDSAQASAVATLLLAQVRGLQLDLLVSGDRRRADIAFELALDLVRRQTP